MKTGEAVLKYQQLILFLPMNYRKASSGTRSRGPATAGVLLHQLAANAPEEPVATTVATNPTAPVLI